MKLPKEILNKLKNQPDVWFFLLFLLTFTFTIRKVLFYFPIQGTFNEYSGIYIYISDISLFLTLLFWLISIFNNNKSNLSIDKLWITCKKHNLSTLSRTLKDNLVIITPLIFVIFAFLSILWSDNKLIALYRSSKLFEFCLLYIYIIFRFIPLALRDKMFHVEHEPISSQLSSVSQNVPRGTFSLNISPLLKSSLCYICSTWNIWVVIIIGIGVFHSIIAILQFLSQHSISLSLLGESLVSPAIPGVAKIVFHLPTGQAGVEHYIRAYGLFPHPNILGGYLLLSILATLAIIRMFHLSTEQAGVEHSKGNKKPWNSNSEAMFHNLHTNCSTWNISTDKISFSKKEDFLFWILIITLIIQCIALFFSFSKSAILGLGIALLYIYVPRGTFPFKFKHTRCSTWNIFTSKTLALLFLIFITGTYLVSSDLRANLYQSMEERLIYVNVSRGTILDNPMLGVGQGQFVIDMQKYSNKRLETWEYQPVHNIFLLIWSELGVMDLALFCLFLYNMFQSVKPDFVPRETKSSNGPGVEQNSISNVPRGTFMKQEYLKYLEATLLGFIFIMLWDHYSWDIQQGQAALWLVLGFIVGIKSIETEDTIDN